MALDESRFETLANETLHTFMETIEEVLGDELDVDLQNGILNIELEDGRQYVINRHGPNRQIWMSSPTSGATHYDYDESSQTWVSTRGGGPLHLVLAGELSQATGEAIEL